MTQMQQRPRTLMWVKGHQGERGNEEVEGTGEEGCRMVCGGGEVCGMRRAGRDVIRSCKSVGRAGTGPGGERGTWHSRGLQSIAIV